MLGNDPLARLVIGSRFKLEFQFDANLIADLLRPVLKAIKTGRGDRFLVEYFLDVCGQVVERSGVQIEDFLDWANFASSFSSSLTSSNSSMALSVMLDIGVLVIVKAA
jgi:hypothetical protein